MSTTVVTLKYQDWNGCILNPSGLNPKIRFLLFQLLYYPSKQWHQLRELSHSSPLIRKNHTKCLEGDVFIWGIKNRCKING